jgi:hypothetical protein
MTVLVHDVESGVDEKRGQVGDLRRRLGRQERIGLGDVQVGAAHPPDGGRVGEQRRAARQQSGVALDDEVQIVDPVLPRPRHGLAERSAGVVVGEDPCGRSGDPCGAAGKARPGAVLDTEVAADQGAESDVEQS